MSYTISANYRDRQSPYKWLVRRTEDPVSTARAYKRVEAKGVRFTRSNAIEEGFGCRQVAVANEAEVFEPNVAESKKVRLKYAGNGEIYLFTADTDYDAALTGVAELHLSDHMEAVL